MLYLALYMFLNHKSYVVCTFRICAPYLSYFFALITYQERSVTSILHLADERVYAECYFYILPNERVYAGRRDACKVSHIKTFLPVNCIQTMYLDHSHLVLTKTYEDASHKKKQITSEKQSNIEQFKYHLLTSLYPNILPNSSISCFLNKTPSILRPMMQMTWCTSSTSISRYKTALLPLFRRWR